MGTEQAVAQHYTHGALERAILDGLRAAGKDLDRLEPSDLAPVDEFHIGGRCAYGSSGGRRLRARTDVTFTGPRGKGPSVQIEHHSRQDGGQQQRQGE